MDEKEKFWSELHEVVEIIRSEGDWFIEADLNGHVGEGNRCD